MKFTEFKSNTENGKVFPIYLFEGEQTYFAKEGYKLLERKFLSEPSLNLAKFDGSALDINEFIASALAYPFMSEKRITLVEEFYPKQNVVKSIEQALGELPQTSLIVIINQNKCEALSKLDNLCLISCVKEDASTLARWIKAKCASNGATIDLECAKTVAEYCLLDMNRIEIEVKKLCDYVLDGAIDFGVIDLLIYKDSEHKIYEMTDYVAKRKFNLALSVIEDMLSKGEPPQKIITSIYYYFRKLLHASISNQPIEELAITLGVKEFAVKRLREQAKNFTKRALKQATDYLIDADVAIKSGRADEMNKLWLSVFNIMTN